MNNGYLKFTGDYAMLKSMGYTFQKLYANNYMSWHKHDVFIFKKGADVSSCEINLYQLVTFMRTHPVVKKTDYGIMFYKFYISDDCKQYEFKPYNDESFKRYGDNMKTVMDGGDALPHTTVCVSNELLALLRELNKLGWYELVDL